MANEPAGSGSPAAPLDAEPSGREQVGGVDEIAMLTRELRIARPPRLAEVKRRLSSLRQEVLNDLPGAMELLELLLARAPSDDESRQRFVSNSLEMNRSSEAARVLSRVLRPAPQHA